MTGTGSRDSSRIQRYTSFWTKDTKDEGQASKKKRLDEYEDVVNAYYDGATALYEFGWCQSFHFARWSKDETFLQSLTRHEHYLACLMGLKPGMRVLDIGSGVGGPARELARFLDITIVGINNNDFQISRARKYTREAGLQDRISYVKGDFTKLTDVFEPESFDAVYAIDATVHAPSWEVVYGEIHKVLKPGGMFGLYEWCMTSAWDPSIPAHKDIAHRIELGNGIAEMRTIPQCITALHDVGFKTLHQEDLADKGDAIPWYHPLCADFRSARSSRDLFTAWRCSWHGKLIIQCFVKFMESIRLAPKGTYEIGESLKTAGAVLAEAGKLKLFTPMLLVVSQKEAGVNHSLS